ncbi:uncharacterized protein JCM6883_000262 [Sporobolomyces salmoneus]|uniref:uncharacterized protein n=1 Tax=Sporobolomyces salmoneus TaxID=183962 RepID=UPI00317C1142
MDVADSQNGQISRIDHLSTLPHELLETIFRLASDKEPCGGPLSKRLFAFWERELYRKFDNFWQGYRSFPRFVAKVQHSPRLCELVESLKIITTDGPEQEEEEISSLYLKPLETLLPLLPTLRTLHFGINGHFDTLVKAVRGGLALRNLRSLNLYRSTNPSLDILADFPSLESLSLDGTNSLSGYQGSPLPMLKALKISTDFPPEDDYQVLDLIRACPALTRFDFDSRRPDTLYSVMEQLPRDLKVLKLTLRRVAFPNIDLHLPRFQTLVRLDVDGDIAAERIHLALVQLPSLVYICLAFCNYDPAGLQLLVAGPDRLPLLRTLTLHRYPAGRIPDFIEPPSTPGFDWDRVKNLPSMEARGYFPLWVRDDPSRVRAVRDLQASGEEYGIEVEGTLMNAIEIIDDFFLEANNRSILHAYYDKDFYKLERYHLKAVEYGCILPPAVDRRSFRKKRIDLVETELPEQDWFVLSLVPVPKEEDDNASEDDSKDDSEDDSEEDSEDNSEEDSEEEEEAENE